mgnify:CR=1 FL=1
MTALNKEKQEFQKKYESNAFLSPERAQQEYNRLAKMEQDLQELSNKLQNGLMEDNNANSLLFRDSINAFLKEYNKTRGYSLIFSNTGFDNLLYADSAYNITKEIVDGLNARYSSAKKLKNVFFRPLGFLRAFMILIIDACSRLRSFEQVFLFSLLLLLPVECGKRCKVQVRQR